jgi:hypothetical protein
MEICMNERIWITKKIDSATLYIPELENYVGKNVKLTVSISSEDGQRRRSSLLLRSEGVGFSANDIDEVGSFEGECSFELT